MSTHKHIDKICLVVVILALILCVVFMNGEALGIRKSSQTAAYQDTLFDTSKVHTIDIVIDDWDGFLENAQSEEYSVCSVLIDGEAVKNVGIRAKGNTSLTTVASMDSDRYSFKIEFDQYDSGKSYHGLDKLCLNNIIQDNTYMKDYLTYQMMGAFGVNAPLCSYAYITVNGEDWGLYLAVEAIEEAFLQRNYGSDYGELYKPDSMNAGGDKGEGFGGGDFSLDEETVRNAFAELNLDTAKLDEVDFDHFTMEDMQSLLSDLDEETQKSLMQAVMGDRSMPEPPGGDKTQMPQQNGENGQEQKSESDSAAAEPDSSESQKPDPGNDNGDMPGGPGGGMGSDDVKLQYIDDDPDSYSNIFDNAKTDVTEKDKARLIASLKQLSAYENLDEVVNVEEVLRYFVVHNFVVNGDSYTGSMIHNYYLYEKDGQLSMIPWDYNLAFGTFQGNDASSAVNDAIDKVLSDRPMQAWIFSDTSYQQQYETLYAEMLDQVDIQGIIDSAYELIAPYVEKDPTAFCTYEEFQTGVKTLKQFCQLRTESVRQQLAGSTETVDVGTLDLSDMGTMDMGGGFGGAPGGFDGADAEKQNASATSAAETQTPDAENTAAEETAQTPPDRAAPPELPQTETATENAADDATDDTTETSAESENTNTAENTRTDTASGEERPTPPGGGPGGQSPGGGQTGDSQSGSTKTQVILLAVSGAVLVLGLCIARRFRY